MHPTLFQIPLAESRLLLFGHVLQLGSVELSAFGVLLAVALALGAVLALRLAERAGLERSTFVVVLAVALFAGIFGSRLGFVVLHAEDAGSLAQGISLKSGGLSGTVGLVSAALVAFAVARARALPVGTLFDALAPSLGLGVALTRLGCYLEGCDFGRRLSTAAPRWLARLGTFPARSHAWVEQVSTGALGPNAAASLPVHPSELYECLGGLLLVGLAWGMRHRARRAGDVALSVGLGYLALRVLVDLSRPASADVGCARAVLVAGAATALWLVPRARARHP